METKSNIAIPVLSGKPDPFRYCVVRNELPFGAMVGVYDTPEEATRYYEGINVNQSHFKIIKVPYSRQFD